MTATDVRDETERALFDTAPAPPPRPVFVWASTKGRASMHAAELGLFSPREWTYLGGYDAPLRGVRSPLVYRCRSVADFPPPDRLRVVDALRRTEAEIRDLQC